VCLSHVLFWFVALLHLSSVYWTEPGSKNIPYVVNWWTAQGT
jgi:hypothetical protein